MPERDATIDRVLLIPGLLEPPMAMWPLRRVLSKRWDPVEIWRDRLIFRDIDATVTRLSRWIEDDGSGSSIAIVTHSFGDWLARRAIARTPGHRVIALASVAPVMRSGCIIKAIHYAGGDLIPEIAIVSHPDRAAENLECDPNVDRMVLWAKIDLGVSEIDLSRLPHIAVHRVAATHLSIIMQPNVMSRIERFLSTSGEMNPHNSCERVTAGTRG
ncbi:lipase family protein [Allorhodopirellula solitaria]|uniref:Alpha/beta hydrolase family protein n=1 Tax=Allorhodopirellula solitaria TaxID=2527987 RepID=A0A5C5XVU4_9BACT|nr:hypothetical protein [Allorhodopirellula solitaria]TWT67456.1 hypothetical protein CA85_23070 [Allorhodopirellula solitaria]